MAEIPPSSSAKVSDAIDRMKGLPTAPEARPVMLYGCDGHTLVRQTKIHCVGRLPTLIEWDDGPDGSRTFVHEVGVSYREHPHYLLSIGEVRDAG